MTDIDETKGTTGRNSRMDRAEESEATGETQESQGGADSPLLSGESGISEGREAYREYQETVYGGNPPPRPGRAADGRAGDEMSVHELQAAQSDGGAGRSARVRKAAEALGKKRDMMLDRVGGYEMQWEPRSTDQWLDAYKKQAGTDENDVHDKLRRALTGDGSHLTDGQLSEAVEAHREKLETEGAFEGWTDAQVDNWQQSVEKFGKAERTRARLENFDGGSVEGLPKLEYDPSERSYTPEQAEDIRSKLDDWEQKQLAEFDEIVRQSDEPPSDLEVETMRERIHSARDLYESVTVGKPGEEPGALPEEAPQHLEGEPKPVRAGYIQHLRSNPGDVLGAYQVAEDRTEYLRADDAAKSAQFGVPDLF